MRDSPEEVKARTNLPLKMMWTGNKVSRQLKNALQTTRSRIREYH